MYEIFRFYSGTKKSSKFLHFLLKAKNLKENSLRVRILSQFWGLDSHEKFIFFNNKQL